MNEFNITEGESLLAGDKQAKLLELLQQAEPLEGIVIEVGVYMGGSALLLAKHTPSEMHLFDTFDGMPFYSPTQDSRWELGSFGDVNYAKILQLFQPFPHVKVHRGVFPMQTGGVLQGKRIKFAHLDVDNYTSYLACMRFIYDKMVAGGIIVFDDYGDECCPGAKAAIDLYLEDKEEEVQFDTSAYIIKKS